ncbi:MULTISPECIES: DUF5816 domain-containing protein [Haloarcula]|uniref:DUF5816 domain-containing protein n=2 Tax=Haloarcula sebkhae TaxID=932660 RepID=A0ACC6VNQ8_9EURY|nr:DUF5816 domain-containing protein [Haloarcula sebkhae]GGK61428.1 hypothetical protein GCM10009067_12240 [Haloarcula sebkhae]
MDALEGPDGETLYVDRSDGDTGTKGAFYVVYRDADRERRWGYFCGNCETFNNAMDSMGRIRCNDCSNLRKAEEWDAAHE